MATKNVLGSFIPRHDTAENWARAINFIPKKGELIVFDVDTTVYGPTTSQDKDGNTFTYESSTKTRFKFGDGVTNVNVLPFATTSSSGGGDADLEDYYTKEEVNAIVSDLNDDIVVSETEPTVTNQTIWLQPLTTDTGAVDYIVEQGIDRENKTYYEKWNNGIVKYYATQAENVTMSDGTTKENQLTIPSTIVKTIITHNITVGGLTSVIANVGVVATEKFEEDASISIRYTLFFASMAANFTTSHTIIGLWK